MGQYYKSIILGERPKKSTTPEEIKLFMSPHGYGNGAKLMEHSYQENNFVSTFEWLLTPDGGYNKSRVVWAGDYADNEKKNKDNNLYSLCEDDFKTTEKSTVDYPYILNHSKRMFVDKNRVPEIEGWEGAKIHPLPLLTCEGNGRGGGDFRGESDIVGTWARDIISVEKEHPNKNLETMDYEELIFNIKE